jgi:uncharacterized protein YkwD
MVHARAKATATAIVVLGSLLLAESPSAAAPAATEVGAADQQTILALHNQYRAAAGVAPLVWDDQLAADAQVWVDALVARGGTLAHANPADPNDPATGSAKGEGENLAGGQSAATAPAQWYEEKPLFDAAPNKSGFNDTNPDWVNWGHYTQMMWSATTKIGCGTAPGPRYQITSCRYSPPGNFDGQLAYPGADTLQVGAVSAAPTATDSSVAPVTGIEQAPIADSVPQTAAEVPPTTDGGPAATAAPAESSAPAGDGTDNGG